VATAASTFGLEAMAFFDGLRTAEQSRPLYQ